MRTSFPALLLLVVAPLLYSALSNIDFQLNEGNPAAVAIRFNVAQHSFVTYADFRLGPAKAALEVIGSKASDIYLVPVAIEIPAGQMEQLYARDFQLDYASRPAGPVSG